MKKSTSSIALGLTIAIFLFMPFSRLAQAQTAPTSLPFGSVDNALSIFKTNTRFIEGVILASDTTTTPYAYNDRAWAQFGSVGVVYSPTSGTPEKAVTDGVKALAENALSYSNKDALFYILLYASDPDDYGIVIQTIYFRLQKNGDVYSLPPEATAASFDYAHLTGFQPISYPNIVWAQAKYNFGSKDLVYTADSRTANNVIATGSDSGIPNKLLVTKSVAGNPNSNISGFTRVVTSDGRMKKFDLANGASLALDPIML